jgi:hypothetical protein
VGRRRVTLLAVSGVLIAAIACGRQGIEAPSAGGWPPVPKGFPGSSTPGANWVAGWKYRKAITVNAGQVPSAQSNFPVLINLAADADLSAGARSDGFDIVFTSGDGVTKLPHERENYANGTLAAWVQVPVLGTGTQLYMYYGNSAASDQQQASRVWDGNYRLVYHMNDAGPATVADSTTNGNIGTSSGGVTFGSTGQIAGATTYAVTANDISKQFVAPASNPGINANGSFTYRLWIKVVSATQASNTADTGGSYLIDRTPSATPLFCLIAVTGNHFGIQKRYDDGTGLGGPSGGTYSSAFALVEMVREYNTAFRLYVNGALVGSTADTGSKALTLPRPQLGRHISFNSGTPGLNGAIDEFRIQNVARSADWIATEYNNEKTGSTFYGLGPQESAP